MAKKSYVKVDSKKLKKLIREAPGKFDDAIQAVARDGEAYVKRQFNTSPPGRTYKIGTVTHIASRPGYPPNVDTGKLRNSIYSYREKPGVWVISTGDTEYAMYLEFGTRTMAARPFMGPTADYLRDSGMIDRLLGEVFDV
jgi:HK97 gp10 family phage protein